MFEIALKVQPNAVRHMQVVHNNTVHESIGNQLHY